MPKVNIPRVGVVEFPDSMTQEQILQAIETDIIPNYQRPEYGVLESGIRGVKRGLSRMGSLATDIVPALVGSAVGADEYAREQLKEAEEKEARLQRENAPGFTSFKQIEGPLDFLKFGAETLGETLPDVVGAVGTGGIGGLLGKRAAVKGAEELAERIAQKEARSKVLPGGVSAERLGELEATAARRLAPQIKQAQATGQAAGVYLGSYALNTPDVFQSIYEQTGELAPGAATLFGGAVAALDAVLPKQLLDSMSRTEKLSIAEKILEKSGMQPSLLRKATAVIPTTAAKEGITEGTQELITAAAEKFVDENQDLWSSENFNRYLESAVRGAVAGGGFGAVQAGAERLGERREVAREQRAEEEKQFEEAQRQERIGRGEAEQLPLFPPGEIIPPSPGLTFPSAPVEEEEPVTARTKYKDSKEMRKSMLGLRPEPYEVVPSAVEGQMELFDQKGKPTPEADFKVLEKKIKEEQKRKIAEGKAEEQALKEAIAELAPKDIQLLDYARRTGITSTPLFQLVQQATELPQPKAAKAPKAPKEKTEKPAAEPTPAAPPTLLTAEKLKGVGLSPLSGFYRRLVGKDVLADEALVRSEIERAKTNSSISASTIKGLEALETELPLQLTQPEAPREVQEEVVEEKPETLEVTPEGQGQLFSRVGRDFKGMPKEELEANAPVFAEQLSNELKTGVADKAEVLDKVRGLFDALDDADLLTQDERRAFYEIDKTLPITQTQKPGAKRSNDMMYLDLINMLNLEREKVYAVGLGRPRVRADIQEELEQYQEPETATEEAFAEEGEQEVVEDPKDVWDKLTAGMDVPYDSLNTDGKEMWAGAVEGGYANLRVANELFTNFGTAEKPAAEKPAAEKPAAEKPAAEKPTEKPTEKPAAKKPTAKKAAAKKPVPKKKEEPTDVGEREAAEIDTVQENVAEAVAVSNMAPPVPEWAQDYADDVSGSVVWHQGDVAIIQGFSIMSGDPVYAGAKKGVGRTRTDISSYTGDAFTKEEKQQLLDARANLVKETQEKLAENPDGPFKESSLVFASDIPEKIAEIVKGWVPMLGLSDARIIVTTPESGKEIARGLFGRFQRIGKASTTGDETHGVMQPLGGNDYHIALRPGVSIVKQLEVLAHELGHIVERRAFANAPKEVQEAIKKEHAKWLATNGKGKAVEMAKSMRALRTGRDTGFDDTTLAKDASYYWKSFSEWFADQTARWATTQEKPLSVVEKFFQKLGAILKKFFVGEQAKFLPNETVKNWLDTLGNDTNNSQVSVTDTGPDVAQQSRKEQKPKQQRKTLGGAVNDVINAPYENLPKPTEELVNGALNAFSNIPGNLRTAALGFLSLDQINDLYGKIMPSIKKLIKALEVRASDVAKRREFVEKSLRKYHEVFKKYTPEQKKAFFKTFFDTTLEQIEPLTITVREVINSNGQVRRERTYSLNKNLMTANNPIAQKFHAMPEEVRQVYLDMRRDYDNYADELENLITKDVTPSAAKKLRTQFELRRLKVYLPLFRQGNYWLSYTDESGEPVVMAFESNRERELEIQRAKKEKAKDIKEFSRFEDIISRTGRPPVGFVAGVIKTLQDEKVPKAVLDQVYSSYLSLFPAESVRQMYRKRKGIAGFENDAVEVYANVMSRMINQVGNLSHAKDIDTAMGEIIAQGDKEGTAEARDVVSNISAQNDYMMNPVPNKISAGLSSFSYYMYIAGNVSSALVNLTQLPIVVYSLLGGEYGFDNAYDAMRKATSMYLNGGKDNNSDFLPDWTFGKGKNVRSDLKRLYDEAVKQSVIRRSTSHEIVDMRKQSAGDYVGLRAKVETGLAWVFQNSERANREITLIAAYELARKKGLSEQAAIEKAMNVVKMSHGASLSETGPRMFQGNIGRVIFTFKRFAQSQIYLLSKLFNQAFRDADPKVRDVARNQLMGIYGMAFMFAGAQGVPLYGAGSMLVGFLMGDDDEPVDLDEYIRASVGDMVYKGPVNQLLNVDIASRTGFNSLVWRDNPRRLAEVGPATYMLEQMAGPSYSAFLSMQNGYKDISEGNGYRGLEAIMPSFLRNIMKGFRFAIDGATNRDGVPIVDDVNAYNIAMQIAGFTPADLSEAYARAGAKKEVEKKILQRRTSLLDKLYTARKEGDLDGVAEIREQIADFNSKNPEKNVRITGDTISRSMRGHQQREKEMVDGVRITPALRRRLEEEYGADDDED